MKPQNVWRFLGVAFIALLAARVEGAIFYLTATGTRTQISQAGTNPQTIGGSSPPGGSLAFDELHQKLYYGVGGSGVFRINVDGSNPEPVLSGDIPDFEIDVAGGKIYYAAGTRVGRANLDGTGDETIYQPGGASDFDAIGIDVLAGHAYIGDSATDRIYRVGFDGSDPQLILFPFQQIFFYDLEVDPVGQKMYWTGGTPSINKIQRANLDGTNAEVIVPEDFGKRLALDLTAQKIYWGSPVPLNMGPGIFRANLDGSARELVRSEMREIIGIDVGVPEPTSLYLVSGALVFCGRIFAAACSRRHRRR